MRPETEEALDPREYARPLLRRRWSILFFVTLVTVAVYVYQDRKPRVYAASTSVFIQPSDAERVINPEAVASVVDLRAAENQATLLRSRIVAIAVKRALKSPESPDALRAQITIGTDSSTDFVSIAAKARNPVGAANLANAYANAFVTERTRALVTRLTEARKQTDDQLAGTLGRTTNARGVRETLSSRIRQLDTISKTADGGATQVDLATPNPAALEPKPRRTAVFSFAAALVLACLAAFGAERLDRRIRTVEDLETHYSLPILAVVPHVDIPVPVQEGRALFAPEIRESMRTLRVGLLMQSLDAPPKCLVVTSGIPAEGKTTIARNLALAMAEANSSVVLVEADLRAPTLARSLGIEVTEGLAGVLASEASLSDALVSVAFDDDVQGTLSVLSAGGHASNPPAILGSRRMQELLELLAQDHDMVIIDSPPLLAVSDTLPLLPLADGILLVGRTGVTTRDAVYGVQRLLARSPSSPVLGLVADDIHTVNAGYGYGYTYGSRLQVPARTGE
jgi:capsular exopolysaccharide synthesis family protein